jgi:hypothetical protein
MDVEPDFSRLQFDIGLFEVDKSVQHDSQADRFHSSVFNAPSEAAIAMVANPVSVGVGRHDGFTVADSNLIDVSRFFQDGDLSTNNFMAQDDEDFWRGIDQELLAFQSASSTYLNESGVLIASPVDGSFPHWRESSASEPGYLFAESNVYADITQPKCSQELFSPSELGCQTLDFADAQSVYTNAADEYDPIGCFNYTYSNEDGIYNDLAVDLQLDATANSFLSSHSPEDHADIGGTNLCIRPDDLALTSSCLSPLPQPSHPKVQACDEEHEDSELLTTVDIIDHQANLPPSHPIPAFGDLIVNFDLNPRPPPSKRKRSSFTRAGKEKVRLVRDSGACIFCRSRKVSVSIFICCIALAWLIVTSTSALQKKCATNVDEPLMTRS